MLGEGEDQPWTEIERIGRIGSKGRVRVRFHSPLFRFDCVGSQFLPVPFEFPFLGDLFHGVIE